MKLEEFNPTTCPPVRTKSKTPTLTVQQSGRISFNMAAWQMFNLDRTRTVSLLQDTEQPKDWYLRFGTEGGFCIVHNKSFISRRLAKKIADSLNSQEKNLFIPISPKEVDGMHALITRGICPR